MKKKTPPNSDQGLRLLTNVRYFAQQMPPQQSAEPSAALALDRNLPINRWRKSWLFLRLEQRKFRVNCARKRASSCDLSRT
jgi:hypothetical protein